jgi:hypothetical protein
MRHAAALFVVLTLLAAPAGAANVKMPPAPAVELEGVEPLPLTAGLYLPAELRGTVEVVKTSPLDKLKFAVGEFTAELYELNLPKAFAKVVPVTAKVPSDPAVVDVVVSVEILRFEVTIPHPAYNPYTSTAVYKVTVTDPAGETLFTQTATGSGQTSKGMMSGFKAQGLAAEAAKLAMADAAKQALEGLTAAEELRGMTTGTPSPTE